jgi:hypothetical protein
MGERLVSLVAATLRWSRLRFEGFVAIRHIGGRRGRGWGSIGRWWCNELELWRSEEGRKRRPRESQRMRSGGGRQVNHTRKMLGVV